MKIPQLLLVLILFIPVFFSSCYNTKDVYYLYNTKDSVFAKTSKSESLTIHPGDQLYIFVSSVNVESAMVFNMPNFLSAMPNMQATQNTNNLCIGYLVDENGKVVMNKIGAVQAAGLTFKELQDTLQNRLSPYLKDPIVSIRLLNFRVSVLGDVARPGTFNVINHELNILQALGLAGDLLITGKRKNVLLYRQADSVRSTFRIDLTDKNLTNHPGFQLKSGDVIYVEPNKIKLNSSSGFFQIWPSVVSAVTLLILLLNNLKN